MPSTETRRPPIWFLFSVTGVGVLANTMITPNIPDILDAFDRSDGAAGLLVASGALPGVLLAPVIGVLADRFGRKRVLLPCLLLFACGALLGALAPSYSALIGGRLLQGAGGAGLINLALVLIADNWEGLDRTKLIGRNSAVLTAALAVLPLLSGVIAETSSWRASIAVGIVAAPVAAAGLFLLPEARPSSNTSVSRQLRGALAATRQPVLLFVFAAGFLLFVVIFGVFLTAFPVHLEERFGLGPGTRGLVLSFSALGAIVVSFNLGRIRAAVPLRLLLVVSSGCVVASALGLATAPVLGLVLLATVLYGFGDGVLIPALQDVASSVSEPEQRASVMAAWVVAVRAGQTVGPIGAALIFAQWSTSTAMIIGALIFAAVGVMFLFGPIDDELMATD